MFPKPPAINNIPLTRSGCAMVYWTVFPIPIELPPTKNLSRHNASAKSLMNWTWLMVPRTGRYSSRVSAQPNPGWSGQKFIAKVLPKVRWLRGG